jgi:hypothetical protein
MTYLKMFFVCSIYTECLSLHLVFRAIYYGKIVLLLGNIFLFGY